MNYSKSFLNRVNKYIYAINKYPYAFEKEFKTAIKYLNIQDNDYIINLFGGGNPINKYIDNDIKYNYKEYENNDEFCKELNISKINIDNIPEKNSSVDKLLILSTLHHFNNEEREKIYIECNRVLKKDGLLVIGDVLKYSKQANFLNVFVDKYNTNGHKGQFFEIKDKELLEKNGFKVEIKIEKYLWLFRTKEEMIDFTKNLFCLENIEDYLIYENLNNYLNVYHDFKWWYVDWQLIFFICKKN